MQWDYDWATDLSLLILIFSFISECIRIMYSTAATGSLAYMHDYAAGPGRGYSADTLSLGSVKKSQPYVII